MRASRILIFSLSLLCGRIHAATPDDAGRLYFSGRSEKAAELYERLWTETKSTAAALNAAVIAAELGDTTKAVRLMEEARTAGEPNPLLNRELGWLYANRETWDQGDTVALAGRDALPKDVLSRLLQARLLLQKSDFSRARKLLDDLLDKSPSFTLAHYFLGQLYEAKGEARPAIASYERALKEDSHFVEARPLLAALCEKENQMDEAWRHYARLAASDSANKQAKAGMGRLAGVITKKPEEIVPPKKIAAHTTVPPVPEREKQPRIRVGIGSTSGGLPSLKTSLSFRTSQPFVFFDPESQKEISGGAALSTCTIRLDPTHSFAEIVDTNGATVGRFQRTLIIRQKDRAPTTTIINSLSFAPNTSWGGLADKELRGDIEILVNTNRRTLVIVNHVSIEEYVYGVLAAEMPVQWPMDALKAQAVIARTQGVYRKGLHRRHGYDICDEQHCQVYTGVAVESPKVREAVDGTRGQYLTYQGRAAHTVFSSNCGGLTQSGGQAGWGDVAYWPCFSDAAAETSPPNSPWELRQWLQTSPAAYCESSQYTWHPEFRWARVVRADDLAEKISRKKRIGRIKKIQILERNGAGRVRKLRLVGAKDSLTLSKEHEIRKYLGLGSLRSTLFVVDTLYKNDQPDRFVFFGGGWGHAVGFCQSGAGGRAERGQTYQQILEAYYPGAKLR